MTKIRNPKTKSQKPTPNSKVFGIGVWLLGFGIGVWLLGFAGPALAAGVSLSLTPASKTVAVGESFSVGVVLDTGGQAVSSVAAVINYSPALVSPVIVPSNSFVLSKSVVAAGVISLGTGVLAPNFTGSTTIATINFKALGQGTAQTTIVFTGAVTGSSVVLGTNGITNILSLVNSGVYTIGSGSATIVPTTGAVENTMMILLFGGLFLGMGAAGTVWNFRKN